MQSDEEDSAVEVPLGRGESRERAPAREASCLQVFTQGERRSELRGQIFRNVNLDGVDLSWADLSLARFEHCSLVGADFSHSTLRGTEFVDADLRRSCLEHIRFGKNRFKASFFEGAQGLSRAQTRYITRHGGTF